MKKPGCRFFQGVSYVIFQKSSRNGSEFRKLPDESTWNYRFNGHLSRYFHIPLNNVTALPLLLSQALLRILFGTKQTSAHCRPGQVLGVRMSMHGLNLIGIKDPKGEDRKKFIVYVEIDRCATDAIQSVTGCSLGKRS